MTDEKDVSTAEAAKILNISRQTIYTMIKRGSLNARMVKVDPMTTKGDYKIKMSEIKRIQKLQEQWR